MLSPHPYPGEVSSATVSVAPLSLRVSHSFTSRSRICRDTDTASVGTGAAWVAPRCHHLPQPPSTIPARARAPGEGTSCSHGGRPTQKTPGVLWHSSHREQGWNIPEVPGPPSWQGLYLAEPHGDEAIAGAHPEQPGVLVVVVSQDTLQGTGDRAVRTAASLAGHAEGTCASPA